MELMATLRQFLERHSAEIIPSVYGATDEEKAKEFATVVNEVCALASTDRGASIVACDSRSVIEAVKRAASWPLKIGTQDGAALLVSDEVVESTGRLKLVAMQTARTKLGILHRFGALRWSNVRCVYAGELPTFKPVQGDNPGIERHDDLSLDVKRRGKLVGAYAIGLQKQGLPKVLELMNEHEIDTIRREFSRELRDGNLQDIEFLAQYAMAKCVHRFCGRLYLSETVKAMIDDRAPLLAGTEPEMIEAENTAERETVTVPVHDPRGVIARASEPFPHDPRAPRVLARL
jgi:recombinational DNA repair protein RecT